MQPIDPREAASHGTLVGTTDYLRVAFPKPGQPFTPPDMSHLDRLFAETLGGQSPSDNSKSKNNLHIIPVVDSTTGVDSTPAVKSTPVIDSNTEADSHPVVESIPVIKSTPAESVHVRDSQRVLYLMRQAQEAHSPNEESLYRFLWRKSGRPTGESGSSTVQIGSAELIRELRVTKKTIRVVLRSLIEKLALDIEDDYHGLERVPYTYRIWSYEAILRRRRAAGLTHYYKPGGGRIVLVKRGPVVESTPVVDSNPVVDTTIGPGVHSTPKPVVDSTTPIKEVNQGKNSFAKIDDDDITQLVRAFREDPFFEALDDKMARKLLTECRQRQPDIKIGEILRLVRISWPKIEGKRTNRIPYLIGIVSEHCIGESFRHVRQVYEKHLCDQEQKRAQEQEFMRKLEEKEKGITFPNASEQAEQ